MDAPTHVADLSQINGIVGGLSNPGAVPRPEGEQTAKQPQTNHLQERQFGNHAQPAMGPEGVTGQPSAPGPGVGTSPTYKPRHAVEKVAEDAMTMGSGV